MIDIWIRYGILIIRSDAISFLFYIALIFSRKLCIVVLITDLHWSPKYVFGKMLYITAIELILVAKIALIVLPNELSKLTGQ